MLLSQSASRKAIHFWIYYFSLCLLVVSFATSRFGLTASIVLLALNWIIEGNFREKLSVFTSNRVAVGFALIFGLSIFGVVWAKDPIFALEALPHKLPTLLIPLVLVTSPTLSDRQIRALIILFISSVLAASLIGLGIRLIDDPINFREASPFVPATNFSIMLILSAFQLPLLVKQINTKRVHLLLALMISGWFIFFILYLRSFTGLASLGGVIANTLLITLIRHRSKILKFSFLAASLLALGFGVWLTIYMYNITHKEINPDFTNLPYKTTYGAFYQHEPSEVLRENGNLVYMFIAQDELREAWNKRSTICFDSLDRNNEPLKHTLYRFMASKGLTKDRDGLAALSDEDIEAVEDGYTNYYYLSWPGIYSRVHVLMMGIYMYNNSPDNNPTWSTLTERFELWKASWQAFKVRPLTGWGTGHIEVAVEYGLIKNNSELIGTKIRSHNQLFSIFLLWGAVGFILFVSLYAHIVVKAKLYKIFIFNVFLIAFALNGMVNDPIEGQMGQSMFVFFTMFYAYYYPRLNPNWIFLY